MKERRKAHSPLRLWSSWAIGPFAWAVHLGAGYLWVPRACAGGHTWVLHALTLATLAAALGGGWLAWHQWSLAGRRWPDSGGNRRSRTRFMACVGLMISALSALLIIAEGLPNFILDPCL